jgi:hypothetical protein
MAGFSEILVEEGSAESMPGIGEQGVDGTVLRLHGGVQSIDAVYCGEVALNGGDLSSEAAKFGGCRLDLRWSAAITRS